MIERGPQASGFTLIELMIVLVIIALMSAAAMPALRSVTGANARAAAGELAGAARYLFDTAAMRHQTCRLALNFKDRTWWAECTKGKVYAGEESDEKAQEDEEELAERFPDEQHAEVRKLLARAKFGAFTDRLAKKRELPGDARFGEVWTQHQRDPVSEGMAYVYFYPQGQAELAHIPIEDAGNIYTIAVEPFTGRARVRNGKLEVPR